MSAEHLIALQGAMADLSDIYTVATLFAPLHDAAETELLPRIAALGRDLRRMTRQGTVDLHLDDVTSQILGLAADWQQRLQDLRRSAPYQQATAAYAAGDQQALARCLPDTFWGLEPVDQAPTLYFAFSPANKRRTPGSSPFLTPAKAADALLEIVRDGIHAEPEGGDWYENDFPFIACTAESAAVETPVWLKALPLRDGPLVFRDSASGSYRLYMRHFRPALQIGAAHESDDEWWLAYDGSYCQFRAALESELLERGLRLECV